MRKLSLLLVAVFLIVIASTSSANAATYQRFLPGGLPQSSSSSATHAVLKYADMNSTYGNEIARQTGASSYHSRDYTSAGWGKAPANTLNTAETSSGGIVKYADAVGTKTVRIRNKKTGVIVHIMVRCGNPRLTKGGGPPVVHKVKIRKILRMWVNKKVTAKRSIVCPGTNQKVTGTATASIKGWFKTTVKGTFTGSAKIKYQQQIDAKLKATVKLQCVGIPVVPPPPPNQCSPGEVKNSSGVCVVVDVKCEAGKIMNSNGVCVTQTNTAEQNCKAMGGTYNGNNSMCTIIQVNGNCSNITIINGSDDTTTTHQEGNCNTNVTPPPPANRPPSVQIINMPQHVYVGGTVQICALATDPESNPLTVTWSAVRGTVSTAFRPDPSGNPSKWCTRYTAPGTSGSDTVTVTVNDGEYSATDQGSFPNPSDDFGTRRAPSEQLTDVYV